MFIDYYAVLQVDQDCSQIEIKKAYRNLASKWHPDKNISKDTTEKMKVINEAYLILSDTEARLRYDKQYARFCSTCNSTSPNKSHSSTSSFEIDDDVLNDWIAAARSRAQDIVKQALDDIAGTTGAAVSGCFKGVAQSFVPVIIVLVFLYFVF